MVPEVNKAVFSAFPVLRTERLLLNAFDPHHSDDIHCLFRLRSEPETTQYGAHTPYTDKEQAQEHAHNLETWYRDGRSINWAIRPHGSNLAIGYFCIWNIRFEHLRGEVGYTLFPEHWRKGYIQEAGRAILDFAYKTMHLHSLDATIAPENLASKRTLLSLGFEREGYFRQDFLKNGIFEDSEKFGILLGAD